MKEIFTHHMRTHTCGELRVAHIGTRATLCGWVHRRRDHGGLIFIDLRDRWGLTQVVFNPQIAPGTHTAAEGLRNEYVIAVAGTVRERPEGTENPKLATGAVEMVAEELTVFSRSQPPPFSIEIDEEVGEEVRLKYRYLDLRRPALQQALELRHRVMIETRNYFDSNGFLEIETPILTKSTPEGARDYLVPSRTQPGSFFALPQSPQLLKQLLMIGGMERYFQICKCFRDEDLRADRQPEFTQIDMEMSFVREEDIFSVVEGLMARVFKAAAGVELAIPFPRMTHEEALDRFGTDKPDCRFGLELKDMTELLRGTAFKSFDSAIVAGGRVKGMAVPGGGSFSRSKLDELTRMAVQCGAKGLAWFKVRADGLESPIAKFFNAGQLSGMRQGLGGAEGDLLLLVADRLAMVNACLSMIRCHLGRELSLMEQKGFNLLWVIDFPLFVYNEEEKRFESEHHPFTAPRDEDIQLLESNPLAVRSSSYDLVLNGYEIASGSVRIHDEALQHTIFRLLKLDENIIRERFGFFLEAFRYGVPPHAGIAIGLDRLVMIMAGRESIREVIGFPKTQKASCLMTGSPSPVSPEQLKELSIKIVEE
ncbi:MAG: aspartate--tRNA ligase [Candidatus Aureabacteria bacterium]|nr:aspartate--tRNA ligase [Candidatus Auribacterota bacterium]